MSDKKTLVGIVAFALAALLAVTTVSASTQLRFFSYPADIEIEGTITLENIETDFETTLDVDTNFTAFVPLFIKPGTYDGGFLGRAVASGETMKFHGLLIIPSVIVPLVQRGSFWVNFRVDKTNDFPDGIYVASGELSIAISPIQVEPAKVIWVHMKGLVTSYGGEDAFGGIMAHARMHVEENDWARVYGFMTQQTPVTDTSAEYTFSFLAFKLVNTTEVELNHEGNDLYISGLWNVYEVTWTHYDNSWTRAIEQIIEEEHGELKVNLETAGVFSLKIDDLDLIEGIVIFYHIRYGGFSEPQLPIRRVNADHNGDWKINIVDLMKVAKSYGTTLGTPKYNFFSDIKFDYAINIADLYEIARTFGQEY